MQSVFPGVVQWFPFEQADLVERSLSALKQLGVQNLRTCFSWADWERPGSREWFDWFIGRLHSARLRLFPSLFYAPVPFASLPSGISRDQALTAYPPEDPEEFVRFVDRMISRYGDTFEWILLWNESNNSAYWRSDLDASGRIFKEMMCRSVPLIKRYEKMSVIGSLVPPYTPWLTEMREAGVLELADAVGIHDFPGTWNDARRQWHGWDSAIERVRVLLYPGQETWITETGYSTRSLENPDDERIQQRKEIKQVEYFDELRILRSADRIFWYSLFDQPPGHRTDNEANRADHPPHDPRADGLGMMTYDGRPKPLFQHWSSLALRLV